MNNYNVNEIADWFLSKINVESGDTISPLKLQKLVYYAQAWHLAIFGQVLFPERIEAWMHGPVSPVLYNRFKDTCRNCTIDIDKAQLSNAAIVPETEQLLEEVYEIYGEHSASYLERLTHSELPWIEARAGIPEYAACTTEISTISMQKFYKQLNDGQEAFAG